MKTLLAIFLLAGQFLAAQAVREAGFRVEGTQVRTDDDFDRVSIGFPINFFGATFEDLYIGTNGYVTFGVGRKEYNPEDLTDYDQRIIAAFYADVDTTNAESGRITWSRGMVNNRNALAVTWNNVGYFRSKADKRNKFQIVLIDRSDRARGDFDFELNYDQIQWEAGDLSEGIAGLCRPVGCRAASAGYSNGQAGVENRSFEVRGSRIPGAFLDSNTSTGLRNQRAGASDTNGRLLFAVINGETTPLTITGITPTSVTAGSQATPIVITGTGFATNAEVRWTFNGTTTPLTGAQSPNSTTINVTVPANLLTTPGTAQITVANAAGTPSAPRDFTINVPPVPTITLATTPVVASGQSNVTLTLGAAAPAALTGTVTLSFTPSVTVPAGTTFNEVRFANGQTTSDFTIAAGATTATLPNGGQFSPGTVAGTITVTVTALNLGPTSVLTQRPTTTFVVARSAPVITAGSVRILSLTSTGFTLEVQGYSPTRELTNMGITFSNAAGGTLDGTTTYTVSLANAQSVWFDTAEGRANGSRFSLRLPFGYSGDTRAIGTASVTLSNAIGASTPVSGGQ
jgi:hypothetical protein